MSKNRRISELTGRRFLTFHVSHFTLLLNLVLLISACHTSKSVENPAPSVASEPLTYPLWFWSPPAGHNTPVAVGYAPASQLRPESAVEAATEDGLAQLAKCVSVRIQGERISINKRQAQNFQEEVPDSVQQLVADTHKILATHSTPTMTLVFVGLGAQGDFSGQKIVSPKSLAPPTWIEVLPRQKGDIYAHGRCNPRYRHESGWQTAESNARIDLALSFQARVRNVFKRFNAQVEAVSSTQTDVALNGIQIIARWFDSGARTYHVLAHMPIAQNEETLRQQWHGLMPQSKAMSLPSQEEYIRRAFDELDQEVEDSSQ